LARPLGISLLELVIVVAILGIVAAAAIPNLSSTDSARLELAASQIAEALRFARGEALRTAEVHGVEIDHLELDSGNKDITVYKADLAAATPFGVATILHHPLSKQVYDIEFLDSPLVSGVSITNPEKPFHFDTLANPRRHVQFDAAGTPVYYVDGVANRLTSGDIQFSDGTHARTVSLHPITGRVTVQ
jgi:type II secretory pathway pseudopilin PulG